MSHVNEDREYELGFKDGYLGLGDKPLDSEDSYWAIGFRDGLAAAQASRLASSILEGEDQ